MRVETIGDATLKYRHGESHYAWLGDSVSSRGGRTRALRLYPSVGPCTICGFAKAERHHKDGNTANNEASNIEVVCRRCHMNMDGRLQAVQLAAKDRQKLACERAAELRRARTKCLNGHSFAVVGFRLNKKGARICRSCEQEAKRRYLAKGAP